MKKYYLIAAASFLLLFSGCLTFHRISYNLDIQDELSGRGVITVYDIRSDAETETEFDEDKYTLFDYILKSENFIKDMEAEGKNINSRNLFVEDDLLNGKAEFNFNDIRDVEGIEYQDGFYFITMDLQDSIYSTNGEIIYADDYKRIIWGKDIETIKFEMISTDYDDMYYRDLTPFYKN